MDRDVVVITGAAGGIGQSLARGYAKAGYKVYALDKVAIEWEHTAITGLVVDLSSPEAIHKACQLIDAREAAVHILINNAAIAHFHKPLSQVNLEEMDVLWQVNVRAAILLNQWFKQANNHAEYGRIINIASTRFLQNEADWELYGASKGAMISLTSSLAISLSGTGITVNAISPGWIACEDYETLSKTDHEQHPSGRVGKPEDILNACLFLSDAQNGFINGANLVVDGGMSKKMIYV